jgi:ATP dependent DNA ligase domain
MQSRSKTQQERPWMCEPGLLVDRRVHPSSGSVATWAVFCALAAGKPLLERKKILKALLPRDPLLRYSEHVAEFGRREFAKAQKEHEEGVIAKRAAGFYYSGKRTREWLKFKAVNEQEVVIVGYTKPRRSRKYRLFGPCSTR